MHQVVKMVSVCLISVLFCATAAAQSTTTTSDLHGDPTVTYDRSPYKAASPHKRDADILLIQTADPWERSGHIVGSTSSDGVTSDTMVLDQLGKIYEIATWSQINDNDVDIFGYQAVLIVNDQVQQFYDDYAARRGLFEQYVQNGGTLIFFAAGSGWAGGALSAPLPGGVTWTESLEYKNVVVDSAHPIVSAVLSDSIPLQNQDLHSNYASHGYFGSLPSGSTTVLEDTEGFPTLVEYKMGRGTVIASTLTWEHNWSYYTEPGTYGIFARKALDDVFLYAFSISGGYQPGKLIVDIYPEDNWLPVRPKLWRAQGDLIDIVTVVRNLDQQNIPDVELRLEIDGSLVDSNLLAVYRRNSAEHIAIQMPSALVEGTDYTDQTINGTRTITIPDLEIPVEQWMPSGFWNDFVFRFRLKNPLAKGTKIDASAFVKAPGYGESTESLSAGGEVEVITNGRIILTNREALYKHYVGWSGSIDTTARDEMNQLWESLYSIAEERQAVLYHVDEYEYVEDSDHSSTNDIVRHWIDHRRNLDNGGANTFGNYHYDSSWATNAEENAINKVSLKIDSYLNVFIQRAGGLGSLWWSRSQDVLILGGDAIIPFYRSFCPGQFLRDDNWKDSKGIEQDFHGSHRASAETLVDAENNFLFTDVIYRDHDGEDWISGRVEDIFVGRIAGPSLSHIRRHLISSNSNPSGGTAVVKAENKMRDGELDEYESQASNSGYTIITSVDGVTLDLPNRPLNRCEDDPATSTQFMALFSKMDFDVFRMMAHGNVEAVGSSEKDKNCTENYTSHLYFDGSTIHSNQSTILSNLENQNPVVIFDNCLVGLVDGNNRHHLANAMSSIGIGSALLSSCITFTPGISDHNDLFSKKMFEGKTLGYSLNHATRNYNIKGRRGSSPLDFKPDATVANLQDYTRLQMNLFGAPWTTLTLPENSKNECVPGLPGPLVMGSKISRQKSSYSREFEIDFSHYQIQQVDDFEIVQIDNLESIATDGFPILPMGEYSIPLPPDTEVTDVAVVLSNPLDLGYLEIPAYGMPAPLPDRPGDYSGDRHVTTPTSLGVVPVEQWSLHALHETGQSVQLITVYPVSYDTSSRRATLMRSATIRIQYETDAKGVVGDFFLDADICGTGQNVGTRTTIENTSHQSVSFEVEIEIRDTSGVRVAGAGRTVTVESGEVVEVEVDVTAPSTPGTYQIIMSATDDRLNGTIGERSKYIRVVSGLIIDFDAPDTMAPGEPGLLKAHFQNQSQSSIAARARIAILRVGGAQVASLPQFTKNVPPMGTEVLETTWIPPADIEPGRYSAAIVVDATGLTIGPVVDYFSIPGDVPDCEYSLSQSSSEFGANGGEGSFSVFTTSSCDWTASTSTSWITILTPGGSESGTGTVRFRVDSNPGSARTGAIMVANSVFTVVQSAPYVPANFVMSNPNPMIGEVMTFTVDQALTVDSWDFGEADCRGSSPVINCRFLPPGACNEMEWTFPTAGDKPITMVLADGRTQTKVPTVRPVGECCTADRAPSASFTASTTKPAVGETVVFTDTSTKSAASKALAFTWSPSNPEIGENVVFTLSGMTGTITKATWNFGGAGCAGASATQICTPGPFDECKARAFKFASGGAKSVTVTVELVGGGSQSAGPVGLVVQSTGSCNGGGGGCSYSLSPSSSIFPPGGGGGSFTVNTTSGCPWTATTASSWLYISSNSGNGPGSVNYVVTENPSMSARTGHIRVEGRTYQVSQHGQPGGGDTAPTSWFWEVSKRRGDGTFVDEASADGRTFTYRFSSAGTYRIRLTVGNCAGSDTASETIQVLNTAAEDFVFPAAVSLAGINDTRWESDFRFFNPCGEPLDVRIEYEPEGTNNVGANLVFREFQLQNDETVIFSDLGEAIPGLVGEQLSGSLLINSSSASGCKVLSVSRTFNNQPHGSLGLFVPTLPVTRIGRDFLDLTGLVNNADYRTNLRLVNYGDKDTWVNLFMYDHMGNAISETRASLVPGHSTRQINDIAGWLGLEGDITAFSVRADVTDREVQAFATVVDNLTGDSVLFLSSFTGDNRVWVVGAANNAGVNDSRWRTDVWLYNPTESWLEGAVEFVERNDASDVYGFQWPDLKPHRVREYLDIVGDELGLEETSGYLVLTGKDGGPAPQVAARTYNLDPTGGTYGLNLRSFTEDDLLYPGDTGYIVGVSNSADQDLGFRTNLGLLNTDRGLWTGVRLTLLDVSGVAVSEPRELLIAPGVLRQFDLAKYFGVGDITSTASLKIEATQGGGVAAYATEIDNRTQDSIFIPAQRPISGAPR